MLNGKHYPISEIFTSPQGEGSFAGQMQTFIRLAGCTVGKPYPNNERGALPIYTEKCTLFDGRTFPCDTDYRVKSRMTAIEICQEVPNDSDVVCITGGEPLMYDLSTLLTYLWGNGKKIHIETSGTIYRELSSDIWVTLSPKLNVCKSMVERANELKILVDKNFKLDRPIRTIEGSHLEIELLAVKKPVFLQPVNFENEINPENLELCMEIQRQCKSLRVSPQMHKVMSVYLKEMVR